MSVDIGDKAPDFTLPSTVGEVSLTTLRGAPVVLFFYPRDNTKGCTLEAQDFSALKDQFEAAGCRVFGVSTDSLASHEKFVAKRDLTIPLISDPDAVLATAFGVWVEKKMYGKTFMGIERASFILDETGTLRALWRKVKVPGHAEEVLKAVTSL